MQVLFHAQIETEKGGFTFEDVCDEACKKLIRRHPHVFGDVSADTPEDVLVTWDAVKRQEKSQKTTARAMADVADALPALWRAEKIQSKAHKEGFDWPDYHGARDKLDEELGELDEAIASGKNIEEELGDVLAAAVNLARLLDIDPEKALNGSSDRFIQRYTRMEELAEDKGTTLADLSLEDKEALWQQAKRDLSNQ
jgi:tetrapyrrole methylase family protein/MazG family protein